MSTARIHYSRLARPVFLWALASLITEALVQSFFKRPQPLGLLPLVPVTFFFIALSRTFQKMDEMQKRICLESTAVAFAVTLILTFVFAGIEQAGLYHAAWDEVGSLMMLLWACAYLFSGWRYR